MRLGGEARIAALAGSGAENRKTIGLRYRFVDVCWTTALQHSTLFHAVHPGRPSASLCCLFI